MTLRMDLACAAMAALALIVSNARAVYAAVQICDVMPERCYYKPNSGFYYTPPPYPAPAFTASPRFTVSPRHHTVRSRHRGAWARHPSAHKTHETTPLYRRSLPGKKGNGETSGGR